MLYLLLKSVHVVAVIIWVSGLLAAILALRVVESRAEGEDPSATGDHVVLARRWDRMVTTPSMLVAWTVGAYMAASGGWFVMAWIKLKLIGVVLLSALHGLLSGSLRRGRASRALARLLPYAGLRTMMGVLGIVALAVTKFA